MKTSTKPVRTTGAAQWGAGRACAAGAARVTGSCQDRCRPALEDGVEKTAMALKARPSALNTLQTSTHDQNYARLIEQAAAQGVDGVAPGLPAPAAQLPAIAAAADAGIDVPLPDRGGESFDESGALNDFASVE